MDRGALGVLAGDDFEDAGIDETFPSKEPAGFIGCP